MTEKMMEMAKDNSALCCSNLPNVQNKEFSTWMQKRLFGMLTDNI
jgi:hypothetical protein